MTRRLMSAALLVYLGLATWMLAARFTAWGDDLSGTVAQVVLGWTTTPPPAPATAGIDFVECFGCEMLPGAQGYGLAFLGLIVGGGPLALTAVVLLRRGGPGRVAIWRQAAFVVQLASVAAGAVVAYGMLRFAAGPAEALHWLTACALLDVAAGVPALVLWRRLQTRPAVQPLRDVFQYANSAW